MDAWRFSPDLSEREIAGIWAAMAMGDPENEDLEDEDDLDQGDDDDLEDDEDDDDDDLEDEDLDDDDEDHDDEDDDDIDDLDGDNDEEARLGASPKEAQSSVFDASVFGDPERGVPGASGDAAGDLERNEGSKLSDYLSNEDEIATGGATRLPPD